MSRNLDVMIYRKLGYEIISAEVQDYIQQGTEYWIKMPDGRSIKLPRCSEDGNAMLELIAEMHSRGWQFSAHYNPGDKIYIARFYPEGWPDDCDWPYSERSKSRKHADILPEAVALAAYYALAGKEWVE